MENWCSPTHNRTRVARAHTRPGLARNDFNVVQKKCSSCCGFLRFFRLMFVVMWCVVDHRIEVIKVQEKEVEVDYWNKWLRTAKTTRVVIYCDEYAVYSCFLLLNNIFPAEACTGILFVLTRSQEFSQFCDCVFTCALPSAAPDTHFNIHQRFARAHYFVIFCSMWSRTHANEGADSQNEMKIIRGREKTWLWANGSDDVWTSHALPDGTANKVLRGGKLGQKQLARHCLHAARNSLTRLQRLRVPAKPFDGWDRVEGNDSLEIART